jgi:hypothetical protein
MFQIEILKAFQLSVSSEISLISTISQKEEDNAHHQLDLPIDKQMEPSEDLHNKCLHEDKQGSYSYMSDNLNDIDVEIQPQYAGVADDYDKLEQPREYVSVQADAENTFEILPGGMGDIPADDTLINNGNYNEEDDENSEDGEFTEDKVSEDDNNVSAGDIVVPNDVQYLWSGRYRPHNPRIVNKVYIGYDWNQYNKNHYDAYTPTPQEDIAFRIVSKAWDYSYNYGFRYHFSNGILQLWFYRRKWKYRRKTVFFFLFLLLFSFMKVFYFMLSFSFVSFPFSCGFVYLLLSLREQMKPFTSKGWRC